jgi:hypothetical protein
MSIATAVGVERTSQTLPPPTIDRFISQAIYLNQPETQQGNH